MSSAYDSGLKEGAAEILELIFPQEGLEEASGKKMTHEEWFEMAHTLAANLELSVWERTHFNDAYYDMMEDLGIEVE